MSYQLAQKAMGQLGGAWRWFSLWRTHHRWGETTFEAWVWTDEGTARFIAQRALGATPHFGKYRTEDFAHTGPDHYRWFQVLGSPDQHVLVGAHTSWVYTNHKGALGVNYALDDSWHCEGGTGQCLYLVDPLTGKTVK